MKEFIIGLLISLSMVSSGWAHDKREVAGKFTFIVGFVTEPAFAGSMNGVDLRVLEGGSDKPVEGLEKTLEVTVIKDGTKEEKLLPFRPRYKDPGRYAAYFMPTAPGSYIFEIKGSINGVKVNETFQSGKDHFHDVEIPVRLP